MKRGDFNIDIFVRLGEVLMADRGSQRLAGAVKTACETNPWFSPADIDRALNAINVSMLRRDELREWLSAYGKPPVGQKRVGVIMAGNIPLVGFFDMLCVLVCGHICCIKPSSKDKAMTGYITGLLKEIDPGIKIESFDPSRLDALIATGNNETNRYFRSEYGNLPSLLRSSRTSVAVLAGNTTDEELRALSDDIFAYNSMGCRSVTHLWLPVGYDVNRLAAAMAGYHRINPKFLNAYRYRSAELKAENVEFTDGGFFVLRPCATTDGRVGEVTYNFYDSSEQVYDWLSAHEQAIQCAVGRDIDFPRTAGFGSAQSPRLNDYPDGKDVVRFLLSL